MVKYFLKGTDQEVKVGNKIKISVPTRTPYGEGICEVETLVTQVSLTQLCKDGIIEEREIPEPSIKRPNPAMPNFVEYKPFIRKLARKMHTSFDNALAFLDILHDVSPYAHNCLLEDIMAEEMNKEKEFDCNAFIINHGTGAYILRIPVDTPIDMPKFTSNKDARKAFELIKPFMESAEE